MIMKKVDWRVATLFVQERHYSSVMPKLTKHWLGCYENKNLVGVLTLGWGTRPKHTIQKIFPELNTQDYYEIGKMCMSEDMVRNSESQMLSKTLNWMKQNTPNIKYLYTWADGIVGKPGYVYQSANFLYGGFVWTDVYITENGEKVHPRTMQGIFPNNDGLKYGHRPNFEQLKKMKITRVFGKQFRYIYPMNKTHRKHLKNSTMKWNLNYPKDKDLQWKVKGPGETEYTLTNTMPYKQDSSKVNHNSSNVNKVVDKYGTASLENFLD